VTKVRGACHAVVVVALCGVFLQPAFVDSKLTLLAVKSVSSMLAAKSVSSMLAVKSVSSMLAAKNACSKKCEPAAVAASCGAEVQNVTFMQANYKRLSTHASA